MNKGGKPKHCYWTEGDFIQKRNDKGKLIAYCKVCNKSLQNTAIDPLKAHRKECRYKSLSSLDTSDPNCISDNIDDIHNYEYPYALDDHNYGVPRKKIKIACKDDTQDQHIHESSDNEEVTADTVSELKHQVSLLKAENNSLHSENIMLQKYKELLEDFPQVVKDINVIKYDIKYIKTEINSLRREMSEVNIKTSKATYKLKEE